MKDSLTISEAIKAARDEGLTLPRLCGLALWASINVELWRYHRRKRREFYAWNRALARERAAIRHRLELHTIHDPTSNLARRDLERFYRSDSVDQLWHPRPETDGDLDI